MTGGFLHGGSQNLPFRMTVWGVMNKGRAATPKTPQNAPFVKRGISEKPRKTPGFHLDSYIRENSKRSSF